METNSEIDATFEVREAFEKFDEFMKEINSISNGSLREFTKFMNNCDIKYNQLKIKMRETLSKGSIAEQKNFAIILRGSTYKLKKEYESLEFSENNLTFSQLQIEKLEKELEEERKTTKSLRLDNLNLENKLDKITNILIEQITLSFRETPQCDVA